MPEASLVVGVCLTNPAVDNTQEETQRSVPEDTYATPGGKKKKIPPSGNPEQQGFSLSFFAYSSSYSFALCVNYFAQTYMFSKPVLIDKDI